MVRVASRRTRRLFVGSGALKVFGVSGFGVWAFRALGLSLITWVALRAPLRVLL